MRADGSDIKRLTSSPKTDTDPTWSPDGTQLAFESKRDGNSEIYVMGADGSAQRNLTHNPDRDICPAWSPTDSRIAYINGTDLYTIAPDGSSRQRLASDVDGCPAWSPDGRQIAFSRTHGLRIMSADGTSVRALTTPTGSGIDRSPTWSADATEIAFVRTPAWPGASEVDIIHVDGTGVRKLVRNGAFDPAWSPDGRTILYTAGDDSTGGGDSKIHAIAPSGSSDRPITDPTGGPEAAAWQALP